MKVGGVQVVGTQQPAIADLEAADVGEAFDQETLNGIIEARDTTILAILEALRAHGLIGIDPA